MPTYVIRDGKAILKELAEPLHEASDAPNLIRDNMDATWHPANGKLYDSKAAFRQATKAAGCIEIGDQAGYGGRKSTPRFSKEQRAMDIKRSIEQLQRR
jgi:hypothetical protein